MICSSLRETIAKGRYGFTEKEGYGPVAEVKPKTRSMIVREVIDHVDDPRYWKPVAAKSLDLSDMEEIDFSWSGTTTSPAGQMIVAT